MDETAKATFVASALAMLKERQDKLPDDTTRDAYYTNRIEQAMRLLERRGVKLTDGVDDLMLVVDYAAWMHANRDKTGGMPEWLRRRIAGRWLTNDP